MTRISPDAMPACGPKGCLAVFGVLYDYAADEDAHADFLTPLLQHIPKSTGSVVRTEILLPFHHVLQLPSVTQWLPAYCCCALALLQIACTTGGESLLVRVLIEKRWIYAVGLLPWPAASAGQDAPLQRLNTFVRVQNASRMPHSYRLDFSDYFPAERNLAAYSGSLTTPPCSGNVLWTVLLNTQPISSQQVVHHSMKASALLYDCEAYFF